MDKFPPRMNSGIVSWRFLNAGKSTANFSKMQSRHSSEVENHWKSRCRCVESPCIRLTTRNQSWSLRLEIQCGRPPCRRARHLGINIPSLDKADPAPSNCAIGQAHWRGGGSLAGSGYRKAHQRSDGGARCKRPVAGRCLG